MNARRRAAALLEVLGVFLAGQLQVFSTWDGVACGALAVVCAGYAIVAARVDVLQFVAAGMVAIAVGLEAMERRRERTVEPASTSA